jgi:hypothetical protein
MAAVTGVHREAAVRPAPADGLAHSPRWPGRRSSGRGTERPSVGQTMTISSASSPALWRMNAMTSLVSVRYE